MEEVMIKMKAYNRITRKSISISDREIDNLDIRIWDIEKERVSDDTPLGVIPMLLKNKMSYIPIWYLEELRGVLISNKGNLIILNTLSCKQKQWISLERKGKELLS